MTRAERFRYLASREWALLREKVRARCGGVCERCNKRPFEQTHHRTNERYGHERLDDLQGVCEPCHEYESAKRRHDPREMFRCSTLRINASFLGDMCAEIGPLPPPFKCESGVAYIYLAHVNIPDTDVYWRGQFVGRLYQDDDVHPTEFTTGAIDPLLPPYELPPWWHAFLSSTPYFIEQSPRGVPPEEPWDGEPWDGPSSQELLRRAMLQPGARHTQRGVVFQCPLCHKLRRDSHQDNAIVFPNGRWGCRSRSPECRRAIGQALGVSSQLRPLALTGQVQDDPIEWLRGMLR